MTATRESGLPDSGHRVEFDNGATREMEPGKGRFDLISPIAMRKLAELLEKGSIKYDARNWELGLPLHSFVDSGQRHLALLLEGDTSEDHAVAWLWNAMALVHTQEMIRRRVLPPELNDLPSYQPVPENVRPPWSTGGVTPEFRQALRYSHDGGERICEQLTRPEGDKSEGESAWVVLSDRERPQTIGRACGLNHDGTNA